MSKFLISHDLKKFIKNKDNFIFVKDNNNLYEEIKSHPDILCANLGEISIMEPTTFDKLKESLQKSNVLVGNKILKSNYPFDISYNCCRIGKNILGKIKYLDDKILEYSKKKNLKLINVNQGYTKCSILKLNDEAIITSDISIYNEISKIKSIKAMYLDNKNIYLSDRYTGFIGGASSVIENKVYFFGNYKCLNDYDKIKKFIKEEGFEIKSFIPDEKKLIDFGGTVEIKFDIDTNV